MSEPRDESQSVSPSRAETSSTPAAGAERTSSEASEARARLRESLNDYGGPPRLLEPSEIRARKRPRILFYVWAWELACAVLLATPVHAWAKAWFGARPDGDAALFTPGGYALMAWLGDDAPSLAIALRTTFVLLLVFGILGQLVTGTLVASLATGLGERGRAPSFGFALRAGLRSFFPLLAIGIFAGALEAFLVGIGALASSSVDHALVARLGDARAFTGRLVVLALFVFAALLIGVIADLARVTAVRDVSIARAEDGSVSMRVSLRDAAVSAASTARRALGRATLAWGWRALLAIALIVLGALAGDLVGARAGGALWVLFFVHQAIVFLRAALRASWLANALRLVSPARASAS